MGNCIGIRKEEWEVKKEAPLEKQLWPEMRTLLDKTPKEIIEEKDSPSTMTAVSIGKEPKSLNKLPRGFQERPASCRDNMVCASKEGVSLDEKSEEESHEWLSLPKNPTLLDPKSGAKDDSQTIKLSQPMDNNRNTTQTKSPDNHQTSAPFFRYDLPAEISMREKHSNEDVDNSIDVSDRHNPEERWGEGSKNGQELLHDDERHFTTTPSDNHNMGACARNTDHPNLSNEKNNRRSPEVSTMANLANSNYESAARLEREKSKKNTQERQQVQGAPGRNLQQPRKKQAKQVSKHLNPNIAQMALSTLAVSREEEIRKHELSPMNSIVKGRTGIIAAHKTTGQKMPHKY
mmetsp:Transcript_22147/g.34064  ORF Transcript_22147/g.34064 Transcript_22147/m.34064 type:complete len:347 (+) Transcript_22147:332-1372(+)|eukprot:CAMPEP_0195296580 /NCGR_PEP_ID=MMETSP0707-20130614/19763_1 /TAXON_ID=33640 /ORGANISM="Asterionellopsis glacialis, Strain CCMP134" /LENGTH=346 /DNA_ID=CAMNT_0040358135 /DNA_START=323 /DNA_END=1363 /DNA_ORIENTATION=+